LKFFSCEEVEDFVVGVERATVSHDDEPTLAFELKYDELECSLVVIVFVAEVDTERLL